MKYTHIRVAARAIILEDDNLLLVNAYATGVSDLWCAPGGGVDKGSSLPENLAREVFEETGLTVDVGAPCLVNEFHEPDTGFHQVEVFFRCTITKGKLDGAWVDPEHIVSERRFFSRDDASKVRSKPDSLVHVAWGETSLSYDPLEVIEK